MLVPSLPVIRHGCLLHSLAGADPRLQLLSNCASWYSVPGSGTCTCTREQNLRLNKIFAWFNFFLCARATKTKQREKLKGEVYLMRKFPDLRYFINAAIISEHWEGVPKILLGFVTEPENHK